MSALKTDKKQYYYLVSGEIQYTHPDAAEGQIGTQRLNAMLQIDDPKIRHRELGKAQQVLQLHFFNRMKDPTFEVIDVFLYAVSPLGHMTDAEFNIAPEGIQAEVAKPTPIDRALN